MGGGGAPSAAAAASGEVLGAVEVPVPGTPTELSGMVVMMQSMMQRLISLEEKRAGNKDGGKNGDKYVTPLARLRGVDQLPTFEGKHDTFQLWKEKITSFLGDEAGGQEVLEWAEQQEKLIDFDDLDDCPVTDRLDRDIQTYAKHLHGFLAQKTTGTAHAMVQHVSQKTLLDLLIHHLQVHVMGKSW